MSLRRAAIAAFVAAALATLARTSGAEPKYLAKQYPRCASCHYSAAGGGLLTPYGRALAKNELSSFGRTPPGADESARRFHEEEFLFGVVKDRLKDLQLGIDLRPARLKFDFGGFKSTRDFLMRADTQAAFRRGSWTAYGEVGRAGGDAGAKAKSYEHWVSWSSERGIGVKAGRFLPAFGVRFADHTAFSREGMGLDEEGQIYGVEISETGERHLLQVTFGPGRAESILHDDGERAFTALARLQWEPRGGHVIVLSGMYRDETRSVPRSWVGSLAHGWSPHKRVALWTELDERATRGWKGTPEYTIVHEASVEVVRGVWVRLSPQIVTEIANVSGGTTRLGVGMQLLPRPHWDLNLDWYRERDRKSGFIAKIVALQLHMYL